MDDYYEPGEKEEMTEPCSDCGESRMVRWFESEGPADYREAFECTNCGSTFSE